MPAPLGSRILLDFDLRASFFKLLLQRFGVGLGSAFLHGLRSAVDDVLGFLQAQAGSGTDDLDDLDLLGAGFEQHDVEFGLLFNRGSGSGTRGSHGQRGSGHAELLFERLDQVVQVHHGHVFTKLFAIISFYCGTVFFVYSDQVVTLVFGDKYLRSGEALKILALGIPFLFNLGVIMITAIDKQKVNTVITGIAAALNLVLATVLIYFFDIKGASVSIVVTYSLIFILSHLYLKFKCNFSMKTMLLCYMALVTISGVIYFLEKYYMKDIFWIYSFMFTSVAYFVLVAALMIRKNDIRLIKDILGKNK